MHKIQNLMDSPRMYMIHDFLSEQECDFLIETGGPLLRQSTTIGLEDGAQTTGDYRTSKTMFFQRQENQTIIDIENRIKNVTGFEIETGEALQLVKYDVGEYYKPHYDYFDQAFKGNVIHAQNGGQRMMTVLMYLNDVESGGQTGFPELGIQITPKKGRAIFWWNCFTDATIDPMTLHEACPVLAGEKWVMTKWLHEREYRCS